MEQNNDQSSRMSNNALVTSYSPTNLVNRRDQLQSQGSSSHVNVDDGNYIDPYFRTLPPGIRFCPNDQELVVEYLMKKMRNEPLPKNRIHEVNIYEYHPKTLAEKYKLYREDAWYFFTTRAKKYSNGNRPNRGVPGGFWKPTGSSDTKILDENNPIVEKRSLDFYEGIGKGGVRTDWKMHEYYPTSNNVSSSSAIDMRLNDCILCRIYLKGGKQKAEAKTSCKKSKNDANTGSHDPADSRNDASTSSNNNSQQSANHAGSTGDPWEIYFNGSLNMIQACYGYNMNQCCYVDNRNQIVALMEPAMFELPNAIEGTSRGVAFAGPRSSMPLTMHAAGLNGPSSSMPLTMHAAGSNGPSSSMPPTTLPRNNTEDNDSLVEPNYICYSI